MLGVHQEEIKEVKYDLILPYDEKELNSGLQTFIAFFDLNTRKVPASIPDMTACSLNGARNEHESLCNKTGNQPNTLLVSIRFKICCRNWKVSL